MVFAPGLVFVGQLGAAAVPARITLGGCAAKVMRGLLPLARRYPLPGAFAPCLCRHRHKHNISKT